MQKSINNSHHSILLEIMIKFYNNINPDYVIHKTNQNHQFSIAVENSPSFQ